MPCALATPGANPLGRRLLELGLLLDLASVASSYYTVRITTGTASDNEGRLIVYADGAKEADGTFEKGSIVLQKAFTESNPTITVTNPSSNAWVGAIEASANGAEIYVAMVCANCTSGTDGAAVSVDGNADLAQMTECINGAYCSFYVPDVLVATEPATQALQAGGNETQLTAQSMCARSCWVPNVGQQTCENLIMGRMEQQAGASSEPGKPAGCVASRDLVARYRCAICGACDICETNNLQRFETEAADGSGASLAAGRGAGGLRSTKALTRTSVFIAGAGFLLVSSLALLRRASCQRPGEAMRELLAPEEQEEEGAAPRRA